MNTYWVSNTLKKYWYWIFNTFWIEVLEKVLILSAWRSNTQYFFQEHLSSSSSSESEEEEEDIDEEGLDGEEGEEEEGDDGEGEEDLDEGANFT